MKLYFKTLLLSALSAAALTSCQQSELSDLADVNENWLIKVLYFC